MLQRGLPAIAWLILPAAWLVPMAITTVGPSAKPKSRNRLVVALAMPAN